MNHIILMGIQYNDRPSKYEKDEFSWRYYWEELDRLDAAILKEPDNYRLYYYRGLIELEIKLFREAKNDFNIFLEYYFYEPEGYFQRGLAKFYLNEKMEAKEDFLIAADLGDKRAGLILKNFYN